MLMTDHAEPFDRADARSLLRQQQLTSAPSAAPGPAERRARLALLFAAVVGLASCGGGGGSSGSSPFPPDSGPAPSPSSAALAQACAPGNPFLADASAPTRSGTLAGEKSWIRAYLDEAYLWSGEIPAVDASSASFSNLSDVYGSLDNYFQALKTPALTPSGKRKDQFSFTYPTRAWNDLAQSGTVSGYGIEWYFDSPVPPRGLRVAYVEAGSPASAAGLQRGDLLVTADGVSADVATPTGVDTLNAALFPAVDGQTHSFLFSRNGLGVSRSLTSATVVKQPVPSTQVLVSAGRKVGYVVFNDHLASAEGPLIDAINTLKTAGVTDLVLDLRYNGGGYLYLASELAYMVAGPAHTSGQVFEQLRYNSKRTADNSSADARTPFYDTSCFLDGSFSCSRQAALPTLNLSRVSVLTSGSTCSASEAIINGLRGVNVDVRLIGDTTCGKPYGFTARDNCGISYFPIEFQGVNAKGFGDYADGFLATCPAADDFAHALGDTAENQLAAALYNLNNNACSLVSARARPQQATTRSSARVLRGPERENRVLLPHAR